jgi:hypothetical protein
MKGQVTYVNEGIAGFLNSFYAISDTPGNHETYASQFTKDALFVMAGKRNTGYDGGCRRHFDDSTPIEGGGG